MFKVHLVCLQSTRVVLLPKEINYGKLINYCKQKFSINNTCMINLTYKLCSDTIDLCDDDDIEVFINDILSSNNIVPKIFITLSQVIASSKSKSTDFDQNIPLYDPNILTYSLFKYMPTPPRAPPVVIKETKSHAHNIALPINVGDKFDNKVVCMFVIAKKAVIEGYEFLVLKSCTKRGLRPDAYQKLEEAGFDKWSRAYCPGNRYNYMTSNSVESINLLTKHVLKVPITMLMEYYIELIRRWYFERRFNNEDEPPVDELSRWAAAKIRKRNRKSAN
nr:transposase, MuDR, MULE transposase domain protein [Tanacetum cinerariifolium]